MSVSLQPIWENGVHWKDWEEDLQRKLEGVQEASTKNKINESVSFFSLFFREGDRKEDEGPGQAEKYKKYTMKSLILAQDER